MSLEKPKNAPYMPPYAGTDSGVGETNIPPEINAYISEWVRSSNHRWQISSRAYYLGNQDIQRKRRQYRDAANVVRDIPELPNTKLTYNLYKKVVDMKAAFISERSLQFSQGDTLDSLDKPDDAIKSEDDGEEKTEASGGLEVGTETIGEVDVVTTELDEPTKDYNELVLHLNKLFNARWKSQFTNAILDCIIDGEIWLYPFINKDEEDKSFLDYRWFKGSDVIPVYEDDSDDAPVQLIRIVNTRELKDVPSGKRNSAVEVYDKNGVTRYRNANWMNANKPSARSAEFMPYITFDYASEGFVEPQAFTWNNKIPLLRIRANKHSQPLLCVCKDIIDALNTVYSNWMDNILQYPDNGVLVLVNYAGEDVRTAKNAIMVNRVITLRNTPDMPNSDARFLEVPFDTTNYTSLIDYLHSALYEVTKTFDDAGDDMQGRVQDVSAKLSTLSMESEANQIILDINRALDSLIHDFYIPFLKNNGDGDFEGIQVNVDLEESRMRNLSELVNSFVPLGLRVSNETMLEHLPFIKDVSTEMQRLSDEQNLDTVRQMTQQNQQMEKQTEQQKEIEKSKPAPAAPFGANTGPSGKAIAGTGSPNGGGKAADLNRKTQPDR